MIKSLARFLKNLTAKPWEVTYPEKAKPEPRSTQLLAVATILAAPYRTVSSYPSQANTSRALKSKSLWTRCLDCELDVDQ